MKSGCFAMALALGWGTAVALPPALAPVSVTTNVAAGAVKAPDAGGTRIQTIYNPNGGQVVGSSPQRSINLSCPDLVACSGQAATDGAFANAPFASANASASLGGTVADWMTVPTGAGAAGSASNTMQYQLTVAGPTNTTALVHVGSFLQISGTSIGASVSAFSGFAVDDAASGQRWLATFLYSNLGLYRVARDAKGNLTSNGYQPGPANGMWSENELVPLRANAVYTVSMFATAAAGVAVHTGANVGQGSVSAFVDPQFTIDPSTPDAGAYAVLLSEGVGNASPVPEPSTPALWAVAMGLFGGLKLRERRGGRSHIAA